MKILTLLLSMLALSASAIPGQKPLAANSATATAATTKATTPFHLTIDPAGRITSIKDGATAHEYVPADSAGYLLRLVVDGKTLTPLYARREKNILILHFPGNRSARIREDNRHSYIRYELLAITADADVIHGHVTAICWGPINTTLHDTIGNSVGVVRGANYAIGIQGLNLKTSGGLLTNDEGAVFDNGSTATAQPFGSSLQAFTVNRSIPRKITVWGQWPKAPVPAIPGGDVTGSAIAIFACTPGEVLTTIETITRQENLPYAKWKETWIKTSPAPGRPYMITTFTENDVDTFLHLAKRMGMAGVYHEDPFDTWGHFKLKEKYFPHDRAAFKACVTKAHEQGLRLGFHVLSNFITTNDRYVTPNPDADLATAGIDTLVTNIDATTDQIQIIDTTYFRLRSDLNTVRIGNELIRYMDVTTTPPFKLTGCTRGAFGTTAATHPKGQTLSRLIDHPYKVFFPNWQLQQKIAANIARFINETGADQMDFDGHEGTYSTGMGDYSLNSFAAEVFRQADHSVVFGSSRANHYFWHINDYLNWGEPWYGGFRESQSDLRIANQRFYESNYLPNMLGWFLVTAQTTPADIDWMLARAAGFHAGYALVVRKEALANPHMDEIVAHIRAWTDASDKGLFTAEQRAWLRDPANDAELVNTGAAAWNLQRFRKFQFTYEAKTLQPGQPTYEQYRFENSGSKQSPQLVITANGETGSVVRPVIELDNSFRLELSVDLGAGQTLVLGDASEAELYDRKGRLVRRVPLQSRLPQLSTGAHLLSFDATMDAASPLKALITVKLPEKREPL